MKINISYFFFWEYLSQFFSEWNIFETKVVEKSKHTHFMINKFFSPTKSRHLWDNVEKYGKSLTGHMIIWRMCIACWIPKATGTYSEYVIHKLPVLFL